MSGHLADARGLAEANGQHSIDVCLRIIEAVRDTDRHWVRTIEAVRETERHRDRERERERERERARERERERERERRD